MDKRPNYLNGDSPPGEPYEPGTSRGEREKFLREELTAVREKLAYLEREQLVLEPQLAAVREWAKQHRHRWPGTEVESCAKEVLAILDRSDTDD